MRIYIRSQIPFINVSLLDYFTKPGTTILSRGVVKFPQCPKTNSFVVVCRRAGSELELIAIGSLHSHAGNRFVTRCVLTSLNVGATCCGQKLLDTFLCWKSTVATNAMLQGALQQSNSVVHFHQKIYSQQTMQVHTLMQQPVWEIYQIGICRKLEHTPNYCKYPPKKLPCPSGCCIVLLSEHQPTS